MDGWIKLHRKMVEWEWYDDINTKVVFLHLLLTANHKDQKWRGIEIKRGQRLTSIEHLAKETHLTTQNIRTSLNKLKSTNEITVKSTNKNTLVTIEKYSDYQDEEIKTNKQNNIQTNNQLTNNQQTTNKQLTTNKNDKNDNNDKNEKKIDRKIYKCYEDNIGMITPAVAEILYSYIDEGLSEELVCQAIKIATLSNKRSMNYINGILKSWNNKGYKVLADIQEEQKQESKEKKKKYQDYEQRDMTGIDFSQFYAN